MRKLLAAWLFVASGMGCHRDELGDPPTASARSEAREHGANQEWTMTQDTKAAARKFYATLNDVMRTRDVNKLDAVLDPDAIDRDIGMEPGADAIKKAFGPLLAAFPDAQFEIDDLIAEGDKVVVRVTARGTHRGEFLGVPATNKPFEYMLIDVLRFQNGKLVERWGLFDYYNLMKQLAPERMPKA